MAAFEGLVEDIVFRNEDNGWTVLSLKPDKGKPISVVGVMPFLSIGERARIEGEWVEHRDYGMQIRCTQYESITPTTKSGVERYLASGIIRGVGPATAKLLVKQFGSEALNVIETQPERLTEIDGIGPKRASMIVESYELNRMARDTMLYLSGLGLPAPISMKIYKRYGDTSRDILAADPYRLSDDIQGIGFQKADEIAIKNGMERDDERRLRAGVKYVLSDAVSSAGHTYLPRDELAHASVRLLNVDRALIDRAVMQLMLKGEIIAERSTGEDCVYLRRLYDAEADVAARLTKLLKSEPKRPDRDFDADFEISKFESAEGIRLSDMQRQALVIASSARVTVITGGPGTGKTTLINCLIRLLADNGKIELCAPTGRAAKRMTEATGREARTIHRLLEYGGEEETFKKNEDDPLDAKTIIVDEMSMVDIFLMRSLLKAVRPGSRIVLCGDADQLPSVGAGNVLGDLIASGALPVVKLTEVFRQAALSAIVQNAHLINSGKNPVANAKGSDFFMERAMSAERAAENVIKLVSTRLPKYLNIDPLRDIQVMSPMKKGDAGVYALNRKLQAALNPAGACAELEKGDTLFRLGDKVMQIKNDYSIEWRRGSETGTGAFNGDIGFITSVDCEEREICVTYDDGRVVEYYDDLLEELELAYCMSVHKSQGSEFEAVVLPLVSGPQQLMTRNLLYTAVTRAKRLVVITGRAECVYAMVANDHVAKRYTSLKERLREMGGKGE